MSASPAFEIIPSSTFLSEGESLFTTVQTSGVDPGTFLYWKLEGERFNHDDLYSGDLIGLGQVNAEGKLEFQHTIERDKLTEATEQFIISISADQNFEQELARSTEIKIGDSSNAQTSSYAVIPSSLELNEGGLLNFEVVAEESSPGQRIYWEVTGAGLDWRDFSGAQIAGSAVLDHNRAAQINFGLELDNSSEGTELMALAIFDDEARTKQAASSDPVAILDSSTNSASNDPNISWYHVAEETIDGLTSLRFEEGISYIKGVDQAVKINTEGKIDQSTAIPPAARIIYPKQNDSYSISSQLYFSEYTQEYHGNYYLYLEIYNPSNQAVSLDDYGLAYSLDGSDGLHEYWQGFNDGSTIDAGDVYIIATSRHRYNYSPPTPPQSHDQYLASSPFRDAAMAGDDGIALAYGKSTEYTVIDRVGDFGSDPGNGWAVAGIDDATYNKTLIRKPSVTKGNADWDISRGTNADNSEWTVLASVDYEGLGNHVSDSTYTNQSTTTSSLEWIGSYKSTSYRDDNNRWNYNGWLDYQLTWRSENGGLRKQEVIRLKTGADISNSNYSGQTYSPRIQEGYPLSDGSVLLKFYPDSTYATDSDRHGFLHAKLDGNKIILYPNLNVRNTKDVEIGKDGNFYVLTETTAGNWPSTFGGEHTFGGRDYAVQKLKPDGTIEWTRVIGGPGDDFGGQISFDANNNIIVSGRWHGAGQYDERGIHLSKISPEGEMIWSTFTPEERANAAQTNHASSLMALSQTSSGNITIVGRSQFAIDGKSPHGALTIDNSGDSGYGNSTDDYYRPSRDIFRHSPDDLFILTFNNDGRLMDSKLIGPWGMNGVAEIDDQREVVLISGNEGLIEVPLTSYSLKSSTQELREGEPLSIMINSKNAPNGKRLFWKLDGASITDDDLAIGNRYGSAIIRDNESLDIGFQFKDNDITETTESAQLQLFHDSARTQLLGEISFAIEDNSNGNNNSGDGGSDTGGNDSGSGGGDQSDPSGAGSYSITSNGDTNSRIDEGKVLSIQLETSNATEKQRLYWEISGAGINEADFLNTPLSGTAELFPDGTYTWTPWIANDQFTESTETLEFKLYKDSQHQQQLGETLTIKINDTSVNSPSLPSNGSLSPDEPFQLIYSDPNAINYIPGGVAELPLRYNTSDSNSNLPGIGINIHFDSNIFFPEGTNTGVREAIAADVFSAVLTNDEDDLDNDPTTDQRIELNWASFDSSFPAGQLPTTLANLEFRATPVMYDSATGQPLTTRVNYTASQTAPNYDFLLGSTNFNAIPFNLDIDGDGRVEAFSDGLMVIRKLFGNAFAGDALTDKAVAPASTRTSTQIHNFLEQGIAMGLLDVDRDGRTTALGDGVMIIRQLLGTNFDGPSLIEQTLSQNSPYFEQENAWQAIEANINSLKPQVI